MLSFVFSLISLSSPQFFISSCFYFSWSLLPLFHRIVCSPPCVTVTALPPMLKAMVIILGNEGWELYSTVEEEVEGKRNHLIDVFSTWHCHSHSVGPLMRETHFLWLRQGLKAPVREAWEPSSDQTLLHIKQAGNAALCSPTVSKVERSFDKDTTCRRGGDNKMIQWKELQLALHYDSWA